MKKTSVILVLGIVLNMQLFSQDNIKYAIEAGSVEYTMSMLGVESTMTLYFEDFGNMQCSDAMISMLGATTHNRSIINGNMVYILDMNEKIYTAKKLTDEEIKKQANYLTEEEVLAQEGIVKDADEEFLGKTCQVYSSNKDEAEVKFWSWKGLVLKMETSAQGMTMSLIAGAINESTPEKSWYEVPEDFTLKGNIGE